MNPNPNFNMKDQPALPELKRFLDRLLSAPDGDGLPPALQQDYHDTAIALQVLPGDQAAPATQQLPLSELIERTRACIRLQEQVRPADQALETMSAPPAMPEATPR